MLNSHHFGFRTHAWRLGWLGAVALGALTALALWHEGPSTAGDKGVEKDSVTVPPDLAWVRPDAALFATIRPAELWYSAEGKTLREQFPELAKDIERSVEREVELKPAEIESLTVVFPDWSFLRGQGPGHAETAPAQIEVKPREAPAGKEPAPARKDPVKEKQPPANAAAAGGKEPPDREREPAMLWIATVTEPAALARVFNEVKGKAAAQTHKGKTYYTVKNKHEETTTFHFVNERTLVRGSVKQILKGLERTDTETKGALAPALRLAKEKHHLAVGLQLTEKEAADLLDEIGREFRGIRRALMPLFRARAAAGFADIGKETRAEVQVFFRDGTQAKSGLPAAEDALALLRIHVLNEGLSHLERQLEEAENARKEEEAMFGIQILEQLESGLRRFKAETKGSLLRLQAQAVTDLTTMVGKTRELIKARAADETFIDTRNRRKSQNNLKQIGIALHNLHDAYRRFPPAAMCDKLGIPLLSWRVAILPFIEQQGLYNQFKFDEPWNSTHNIKLLAQMPKTFAPVGMKTKEPGMTFYQGFVADPKLGQEHQTAWETTPAADSPFGAWGTRMPVSFPDGTSNTIWVVEAGDAVPWTKPVDLPYDPKRPLPKLGGLFKEGFNALFVDGSARFIPQDFDVKTLRLLITRADGQSPGPAFYKLR